jgi:hypothetical protein
MCVLGAQLSRPRVTRPQLPPARLAWTHPPLLQSGFRSPYSSASAGEVNAFNGNFQSSFDVAYADSDEALFSYVRCVGCDDA